MIRTWFRGFVLVFGLVCSVAVPALPVLAGEIVAYDGTDQSKLQQVELWGDASMLGPQGISSGRTDSLAGNSVTIIDGGTVDYVVGATNDLNEMTFAPVTDNNVFISGGTMSRGVYGGEASAQNGSAEVAGNRAFIGRVTLSNVSIYGGSAYIYGNGSAFARGNSVTLNTGATITGDYAIVYGGEAHVEVTGDAMAQGNSVTIGNASISADNAEISGGRASTKNGNAIASNNGIVIDGGTASYAIGGNASNENGDVTVSSNSVTIIVGTVENMVHGGWGDNSESGSATANNNNVTITGGTIGRGVSGGHASSNSGSATANDNNVTITSGTVEKDVSGGDAYVLSDSGSATANNNSVTITGGTVGTEVYGSYASSDSGSATVNNNNVTITGGTMRDNVSGGDAFSNSGSATANNNSVTISGTVERIVFGSYVFSDSGSATATNNSVKITGGTMKTGVYGSFVRSDSGSTTANNNSVTITGGTVESSVYGGYAIALGDSDSATANSNSVTIAGSTIESARIYGGYSSGSSGTASSATFNTVNLSGDASLTGTNIFGGYVPDSNPANNAFTGNTLNVDHYRGSSVKSIQNFQFYNFTFSNLQETATPVLDVTGTASLGDAERGTSLVKANTFGGSPMQTGSKVTLIKAGTLDVANFDQTLASGQHGATLNYEWTLAKEGNSLVATLDGVMAGQQTKALSEGVISGAAMVNQGADLIAGEGMTQAVSAAQGAGGNGFGSFGAVSGGQSRYNSGSHVDVSSFSLAFGLSWGRDVTPGRLTLGAFFEYGNGSYDTYNSFSTAASVHGDGDIYHLGGGVLGRMDFADVGPGRFYAEASARVGGLHNDYASADLRDVSGRASSYGSSAAYYGLHLGGGYIWSLTDKASLDLSGKYFWTRQEGDSVTLSTGDPVRFDNADSHRLRAGSRFAYAVNECVSPYAGAAYEYEFDGKAGASTYGHRIDAPSLRGGTGIGEVGFILKPSRTLPLSVDLGVQGYVGKREGVTGSVKLGLTF